jgi:hypothetical protein
MDLKEIGTGIVRRVEYHQNGQCVDIQHDGMSPNTTHGYPVTKDYASIVQGWIGQRVMIRTGPSEGPAYDELELELLPESAPIQVPKEIATLRKKYEELVERERRQERRAILAELNLDNLRRKVANEKDAPLLGELRDQIKSLQSSLDGAIRNRDTLQDRCATLNHIVTSLTRDNDAMRHQLDVIRKALP